MQAALGRISALDFAGVIYAAGLPSREEQVQDVAERAGVSTATVSNALTGKGRVSEEMVSRIQARAAELGYRPSNAARALKTGRKHR